MTTYKIVRMYRDDDELNGTVVETGLTLEEAQAHCHDPETSSSTATDPDLSHGPWFDGYEAEEDLDTPEQDEDMLVEKLSWWRDGPQVWHDDWRNADRVCRWLGRCVVCGTRVYAFDDGENDPRGVLGDHAADVLRAEDHDKVGPDVVACFMCTNDYDKYQRAMEVAGRAWTEPAEGDA